MMIINRFRRVMTKLVRDGTASADFTYLSLQYRQGKNQPKFTGHFLSKSHYSGNTHSGMKVTICGATGNTGQPLSLLLKQSPLLDEIALYDVCTTCGCAMELSHVDTKCKISSYSGSPCICEALRGSKVVVIVARNKTDSFENNAPIITELAMQICNNCPEAIIVVATEPIESLVPLVAEIQRVRCLYNPRRIVGCVELNCVRANTVLADFMRVPPEEVHVPVVGGASPQTMVPVFSAAIHPCIMTQEQIQCLTSCIMSGNEAVSEAKNCSAATPCFAGAYAVARTVLNVVRGLQGHRNVVQCAYVDNLCTCAPDCQFFASEVVLGPSGVEKNLGIPELSKFENCLLCSCLPTIRSMVSRAIWLVYTMCYQSCPCYYMAGKPSKPVKFPDEKLATVCREVACNSGGGLCWRPRDPESECYTPPSSMAHQIPYKCAACNTCQLPRSLRLEQEYRSRHRGCPCNTKPTC